MEMPMQEGEQPMQEGGGAAEAIASGLQEMLAEAPTPELKERIQAVMAELGDIAQSMEGGEAPEQMPQGGQSQVGTPQQGSPVV